MIEMKEIDTARAILREDTQVMPIMRESDTERYLSLERLLQRPITDARELYSSGNSKEVCSWSDSLRAGLGDCFGGEEVVDFFVVGCDCCFFGRPRFTTASNLACFLPVP